MLSISDLFLIYVFFMNIFGFALMGIDKYKARKHLWRISERTLFLTALLGGSAGTLAGMYFFRHKTRHRSFVVGMPAILLLHVGFAIYLGVLSQPFPALFPEIL